MLKVQNYSPNSLKKTNFKAKTQHGPTVFNSKTKNTDIKEYKKQLKSLMIAGTAIFAALSITGCTNQAKKLEKAANSYGIATQAAEDTDKNCEFKESLCAQINEFLTTKDQDEIISAGKILDLKDFSSNEFDKRFETSKKHIEDAIKEYDYIHNEVWDNIQSIYVTTKNIDGKTFDGSQNDTDSFFEYQDEEKNFKGFYENYLIAQIAAGKIAPWEGIETEEEVVELIENLINEASHPLLVSDKASITSKGDINKSELDVIYKVLDELEKINDKTKAAALIYKEKFYIAEQKSKEWMTENSLEAELSGLDTDDIKDYYVLSADHIKTQAEKIRETKLIYEEIKTNFIQNQDKMNEDEKKIMIYNLQNAFKNYYTAVNTQISNGNLNSRLVNGNIKILEKYTTEIIKNAYEEIFKQASEQKQALKNQ